MSLYVCTRCESIDNTARAPNYWMIITTYELEGETGDVLCTACLTGRWHGEFPQRRYDPDTDGPIGPGRCLMPREIDA